MLFPKPNLNASPRRVVITGVGIVTALGLDYRSNVEGFREGRQAVRPVTVFDAARQRVKMAAEVDLPTEIPRHGLSLKEPKRMERAARLLLLACDQAWRQSGWRPSPDLPLVLGTTSGGMTMGERYYEQALSRPSYHIGQPTRVLHYQVQSQAGLLQQAFGFRGPITIIANACASGANAIGQAWELIRFSQTDRVLTGGYDALSQMVFSGFDSLQALSPTRCRPFDANRDGLALGEGAAVLTLESLETARLRNAPILAEIAGYGAATDAHHITQPHPEGRAALATMTEACRLAGIGPEQIDYINAHGTGTPLNDGAEAAAINRWAGEHVSRIRVSSTKSSIGHLLGAAGAVETVVCLMALREGWLPPTLTCETPDPVCRFPLVRQPMEAEARHVMTNSFGFGGANASLILKRWEGIQS